MDAYIRYDHERGKIAEVVYQPNNAETSRLHKLEINDGMLILPSEIDGQPVVEIEDFIFMPYGKEGCLDSTVEKLVIPKTYWRLGDKNFSGWNNLRMVYLDCPSRALCQWNFAYCEHLTEVICSNADIAEKCHEASSNSIRSMYGCFDGIYNQIHITVRNLDFSSFELFCNEVCCTVKIMLIEHLGSDFVFFCNEVYCKVKEMLIRHLGRDWIDSHENIDTENVFGYPISPSHFEIRSIIETELLPKVRQYLETHKDELKYSLEHDDIQGYRDYLAERMFYMTIESFRYYMWKLKYD